jgi:hypothetical protein
VDPRGGRRVLSDPVELQRLEPAAVEVRPRDGRAAGDRPLEDAPIAGDEHRRRVRVHGVVLVGVDEARPELVHKDLRVIVAPLSVDR